MSTMNNLTQDSATSPSIFEAEPSPNEQAQEKSDSVPPIETTGDGDEEQNPYAPKKKKHTSKAWVDFKEFSDIAKYLQLPSKKLVLDYYSRWNATYFMLSAALEFKAVFPRYQQKDPSYTTLPSKKDWKKVEFVCSFLQEFNEVTSLISCSEYPTSNLFLTELYNIKKLLNEAYVAVLDPRNKMLFEWCFSEIYSISEAFQHITTICETLHTIYNECVEAYKALIVQKEALSET
ncbi:hypothetical protein PTKIN_Ptkin13bG0030100 [Pterospermum kingtungense]